MAKDEWVSGNEAAKILSRKRGYTVVPAYVRSLDRMGKIRTRFKNKREKEYYRPDVEGINVKRIGKKKQSDDESVPAA